MPRVLRDYQVDAILAVREQFATAVTETGERVTRTSVVAATGTGKTDVIAYLAVLEVMAGGQVLNLAHRDELLDQIIERCRMWIAELDARTPDGRPVTVGRVQGRINETRRDIVVASVATVRSPARQQRLRRPTLVIVDEGHHVAAASYQDVLAWAGCFDAASPTRAFGVSATMVRGDKLSLGDTWQSAAIVRDIEWGVSHGPYDPPRYAPSPLGGMMELSRPVGPDEIGWLVRPRGRCVVLDHLDLDAAKLRGSGQDRDFQDRQLGAMVALDAEQAVQGWFDEGAADRITMAFVPSIAAAEALRDAFLARDVKAEMVIASTPGEERRAIKERMMVGVTRVRVDVGVGMEGFDCPAISCIYWLRPTLLPGLYAQGIGRGLRTHPGKLYCLVLDGVGSSRYVKLQTVVNLLPGAESDRSALERVPCDICGAEGRCLPGCDCTLCTDETGPREEKKTLDRPVIYEDVDLFRASALRWLRTGAGIPFVTAGDRIAFIDQDRGVYAVGHCAGPGDRADGHYLASSLTWDQAVQVAEQWARAYHPAVTSPYKGAGRATPAQVAYARAFGIQGAENMTGRRCSDEIEIAVASRRLDP